MRRFALSLATAFAITLALAGPMAAATVPEHGSFDGGFEPFVDTEVCAAVPWQFDVDVIEHVYGTYEVFFNADGSFARSFVHLKYDAWISANGKTIVERDSWTTTFTDDGSRQVGLAGHIQGPGGIVMRDAGQVFRDVDDNVIGVVGPHPQLLGASFCPPLAA